MVSHVESSVDRLNESAASVLAVRFGIASDAELQSVASMDSQIRNRRTVDILRIAGESAGICSPSADDHEVAKAFVSSTSVNRRGDHPDLLSALTSKALTEDATVATWTYDRWAGRLEDLSDFKPKSFIETGIFDRLDAITEDDKPKQFKLDSSLQNWIQAGRYSGSVALTIEMVVDDDLGGFLRQVRSLRIAARNTLNQHLIELLVSNPTMLDGHEFFSAAHGNLISSGAAPSASQYREHRKVHRLQKSYGSQHPMGLTFDRILVPAEHEDAALQSTTRTLDENKTPNVDSEINTFRGTIDPIIDVRLDEKDSSSWYSIVEPSVTAGIAYAFQKGFDDTGRQREWFDPETGTRHVAIETRFGCAMANWRAMVKNPGQ